MIVTEEFLKLAHAQHRKRVLEAKAIVDNKPPILHVGNFAKLSNLKTDLYTFVERNKTNAELLVRMNEIFRTRGATDCYRTKETAAAASNLGMRIKQLEKIEMENMVLGKRILCTRGELDTWRKVPENKRKKKSKPSFKVPRKLLEKYSPLEIPQDPERLKIFMRPQIWFQLEVKDIRPLGRIMIQLYTEAAPAVVLEFIRYVCCQQHKERLMFVRLFPSLWLEGQLQLPDKTLVGKNLEYDKRALDHGNYAGVLSFSMDHVKYHKKGLFYYAISFKPLRVLNGRRVGFGRVVQGLKILNCIQDYGTKNGKPTKEIVVSQCGIVK